MRDGEPRRRGGARRAAPLHPADPCDPAGAIIWWGTRYEAAPIVLSTLASRHSHCTLSSRDMPHADRRVSRQSCWPGGEGERGRLRGRGTLGHVARAWRLASLACLARVCRRAVRRARCRPPGRGHSGKNHSDRPGAPSAGRVRVGRRTPGRGSVIRFPLRGHRFSLTFRSVRQFLNSHEHQHDTPQETSACTLRPPGDTSSRAFLFASCRAISACRLPLVLTRSNRGVGTVGHASSRGGRHTACTRRPRAARGAAALLWGRAASRQPF